MHKPFICNQMYSNETFIVLIFIDIVIKMDVIGNFRQWIQNL